ncbi:hypothetical protein [Halorubrum tebenquichense]|uniref:Uncharacterized protein n=1 Tax=Halorubrum tebenquichense DSM 14210 TaxID=1227485 RepID=M0E1K7_9EURY|nr:hypothetical protein [Halorubrum tebenquichense]ELZ40837.1 hypothetical protein C472_01257 [Halorubrum tebenquichense DSM 14210]
MTPRRIAAVVVDLALVAILGVAARLTHVLWYRSFEASVAVDLAGSVALGAVFGAGHLLLVASGDRVLTSAGRDADTDSRIPRPRSVAVAVAAGFLLHASQAPAFTPFELAPTGVNRVLTAGGVALGLWSLAVRRAARSGS